MTCGVKRELPPWRNVTGLGNNSACSNGSSSAKKQHEKEVCWLNAFRRITHSLEHRSVRSCPSLLLKGMSFTHRDSLVRNDRRKDRSGCIHHSRDDYQAPMWRDHKDNSLKEIITLILFRMLYTICHPYSEVGSRLAAVWGGQNNRVCLHASPCSPCERMWRGVGFCSLAKGGGWTSL